MTRRRILAAPKTLLLAAIVATTSFHQHVTDGGLVGEDISGVPGLVDSLGLDGQATDSGTAAGLGPTATGPELAVLFPSHPGVCLHPTAPPERSLLAVLLRAVLNAVLQQLHDGHAVTPIGLAMGESVKLHEAGTRRP